jgi:hypothetical protein
MPGGASGSGRGRFSFFLLFVECFHTLDGNFQRFGKSSHVRKAFHRELLLQLVSSKLIDCGAQVLGILPDRINHARKHQRELNLLGWGWDGILTVWSQNFRAHGL